MKKGTAIFPGWLFPFVYCVAGVDAYSVDSQNRHKTWWFWCVIRVVFRVVFSDFSPFSVHFSRQLCRNNDSHKVKKMA